MKMLLSCRAAVSCAGWLALGWLLLPPVTLAAGAPSTGTILQQTLTPAAPPTAPSAVLRIPANLPGGLRSSLKVTIKQLRITGNTLLPAAYLTQLATGLTGKTLTLTELQGVATRLTERYHAAGYPLAYAYLPPQTVRDGVVTLAVLEPTYDRIRITGHSRLKPAIARRTLGVQAGQPVAANPLNRGLLLLSRTPGLRVAGTLVPGAEPETSSLDVQLANAPLVSASVGLDNWGSSYTGATRGIATASLADPFGYGSRLSFNALSTSAGLLHAGGFNLLSPNLGDGLRASLYGSRSVYRLGGIYTPLGQRGTANQYGIALDAPLILRPGRLLEARLDVLRNDQTQTTTSTSAQTDTHIDLVRLTLSGAYADAAGGLTTLGLSVTHGHLGFGNAAARQADAAGAHTQGTFWVEQLSLNHTRTLPADFQLNLSLSGQLASRNLDGSQKFYLGGPTGVMSYPVGEAGGDQGILLRTRLSHALPLPKRLRDGRLDLALLAQVGKVWVNRVPYAGANSSGSLYRAGAGLGLDFHWRKSLSLSLSYVHQIGPAAATAGPARQGEFWGSLKIDF